MKLRLKLFFFAQYFTIGLLGPYLVVFFYEKNFSGSQIGLLLGVMPIAGLVIQPVWSFLSDVLNARRNLLVFGALGLVVAAFGLGYSESFMAAFLWALVFSAMRAPIGSISTAIALDYLEENDALDTFSLLRLWGSVGFGVSSILMGGLFLDQILIYFRWIAPGIFLVLAGLGMLLPESGQTYTYSGFKDLRHLTKNRAFIIYLLASVFIGATMGIYNNYQTLFLQSLDASSWLIGVIVALQAVVEIPMMMLVPLLLKRFSMKWLILAGAMILPVRWFLYTFISQPGWIIPVQLLHGVPVISIYVVGVAFIDQVINPKWRATGQALYSTAMMGVGSGLGVYLAGFVIESFEVRSVWYVNVFLGLVGLGMLFFVFRKKGEISQ